MATTNGSGWFPRPPRESRAKARLFCFPYAGGSASIYHRWASQIPPAVDVIPVELPGRGKRLTEPPFQNLPALIDAMTLAITPLLNAPFALFGHSMGAIIAFELARELRRRNERQPEQIFVSGRQAPHLPLDEPPTYNYPDDEFLKEVERLNGTPAEVLKHAELMSIMLPLLRADFELIQTYQYLHEPPLECSVSAYGGIHDKAVPRESLLPWEQQTRARFTLNMLPGDHFFLHSADRLLLDLVGRELIRTTTPPY